jgi:hypothetical protein
MVGVLGILSGNGRAVYIYSVTYNFGLLRAMMRKAKQGLVFVVNPAFSLGLGREEAED